MCIKVKCSHFIVQLGVWTSVLIFEVFTLSEQFHCMHILINQFSNDDVVSTY